MPNNYLSVLYKHIIQVENKNVGLKVWGGGGGTNIPVKKVGGHMPPPPPPLPTPVIISIIISQSVIWVVYDNCYSPIHTRKSTALPLSPAQQIPLRLDGIASVIA